MSGSITSDPAPAPATALAGVRFGLRAGSAAVMLAVVAVGMAALPPLMGAPTRALLVGAVAGALTLCAAGLLLARPWWSPTVALVLPLAALGAVGITGATDPALGIGVLPLYAPPVVWAALFLPPPRLAGVVAVAIIVSGGVLAGWGDPSRALLVAWAMTMIVLAGVAAVAAWPASQARRSTARQEVLRRVATSVAANPRPEPVFAIVAREAARWLGADGAGLVRFRDGEGEVVGWWGALRDRIGDGHVPLDGDDVVSEVGRTGRPQRIDFYRPLRYRGSSTEIGGPVPGVAAPVVVGSQTWGALVAVSEGTGDLPSGAEERLAELSGLVAMAIENAEARARLEEQASTDSLTGLLNHRSFHERLRQEVERARRHERALSLVVLDLDHFTRINDLHGHPVGDLVLHDFARRLAASARDGDVVARIGGEEFAWLMPETTAAEAWTAAERMREVVAGRPFEQVGQVTVSGGVCDLARSGTAEDILRLADGALYWAKQQGRDRVLVYSPDVVEVLSASEKAERLERRQSLQSIRVLARAVDAKHPDTRQHSERVADLSAAIAGALGWPQEEIALIREAGLVHDVGKIGVPDAILLHPGRLDAAQIAVVREHAALGAAIVADILTPAQVSWVRGHHERWDGRGYPDGLAGPDIPTGARVIGLADAWDVMVAERPYKSVMTPAEAIAECRSHAGGQFDPACVEALERLVTDGALDREGRLAAGARPVHRASR